MIVIPEELTKEVKIRKPPRNMKHLVIGVYNLSLTLRWPLELFVQKSSSTIQAAPVKSGRYISRYDVHKYHNSEMYSFSDNVPINLSIRIICGQLSRSNVPENNLLLCATCHLGTAIVHLPSTKVIIYALHT